MVWSIYGVHRAGNTHIMCIKYNGLWHNPDFESLWLKLLFKIIKGTIHFIHLCLVLLFLVLDIG